MHSCSRIQIPPSSSYLPSHLSNHINRTKLDNGHKFSSMFSLISSRRSRFSFFALPRVVSRLSADVTFASSFEMFPWIWLSIKPLETSLLWTYKLDLIIVTPVKTVEFYFIHDFKIGCVFGFHLILINPLRIVGFFCEFGSFPIPHRLKCKLHLSFLSTQVGFECSIELMAGVLWKFNAHTHARGRGRGPGSRNSRTCVRCTSHYAC